MRILLQLQLISLIVYQADAFIPNPLATMDEETISRLQAEVEAEKKALLASKDMVVEEKQRIAQELEKRAQELDAERQIREQMAQQLQAMEAKLLMGGVNIFDHVNAQQRELEENQVRKYEQYTFISVDSVSVPSCRSPIR